MSGNHIKARLLSETVLIDSLASQETGSLLLANNDTEGEQLRERANQLQAEGLAPEVLSSKGLREAEPALCVSDGMSGLLLKTDAQLVSKALLETLLAVYVRKHKQHRKAPCMGRQYQR